MDLASPDVSASECGPRVGVVLAAGRSERLSSVTGGGSKALVRLGGLAIVQRAVLTLLSYGLERVVVATGYHAGPVGAVLARVAPGRVHAVYAEGWEAGNGASLAAARPDVADEPSFVLITADHLFAEGVLRDLLRAEAPACLIDPAPDPATWAEATKVRLARGAVVALGKDLEEPAVDCGAFLLTGEVFECLSQAERENDHTLAGAVSALARRRPLHAVPVAPGSWWKDIDTPADLHDARRLLRLSLAKPEDGPVSRYLNRPISTRLSMAISPLRPNPDAISFVVAIVGLLAAALLGVGAGLAGALLIQACSVLDGVDGELARLQVRTRPLGALLDGVLDRLVDAAALAGLAVWAARESTSIGLVVALAVAATAGSMLSMATKDRIRALGLAAGPERAIGFMLGARDGRLLLVAAFALLGQPAAALAAVAVTSAVALAVRIVSVVRRAGSPMAQARTEMGVPAVGGAIDAGDSRPADRRGAPTT